MPMVSSGGELKSRRVELDNLCASYIYHSIKGIFLMQIKIIGQSADSNVFEQRPMYPISPTVETVDHNAGQNYHNQKPLF